MGCLKLHTENNYTTLKVVYSPVNTSVLAEQEEKNNTAFLEVVYNVAQGGEGSNTLMAGAIVLGGALSEVGVGLAIIGTAAAITYGPALVDKMNREINGIMSRAAGPPGFVYELRATRSGPYPNLNTGGTTLLNVGDVYKYGQTTQGFGRYSQVGLGREGLKMTPIFYGNQMEILIPEKIMIYGYLFMNGSRPAGNPIFK